VGSRAAYAQVGTHLLGRFALCFIADLGIRGRTKNRMGLQNALRAIVHAGGTLQQEWPLRRALEIGDAAIRRSILAK
jgi:hypothetical protein